MKRPLNINLSLRGGSRLIAMIILTFIVASIAQADQPMKWTQSSCESFEIFLDLSVPALKDSQQAETSFHQIKNDILINEKVGSIKELGAKANVSDHTMTYLKVLIQLSTQFSDNRGTTSTLNAFLNLCGRVKDADTMKARHSTKDCADFKEALDDTLTLEMMQFLT